MFISENKKKNNIAEYVIYMWQIEAIIRSLHFDIDSIKHAIIEQAKIPEGQEGKLEQWYLSLIKKMKDQRIIEKGHLIEVREILDELQLLHDMLIDMIKDEKYIALYHNAKPNIVDLKQKSDKVYTDIETCFNGLYGILQLRLQQLDITEETKIAVDTFSALVAYLSKKYHEMKAGKLQFPKTMQN